jgi:hypothetical protein
VNGAAVETEHVEAHYDDADENYAEYVDESSEQHADY